MALDLYVNSSTETAGDFGGGNDANPGTAKASPAQTIAHAIEENITETVDEEIVIHLARTMEDVYENVVAQEYDTGSERLDLASLNFTQGGSLTIECYDLPSDFDLFNPAMEGETVTETAWTFLLPTIPSVKVTYGGSVKLKGVHIRGGNEELFESGPSTGINALWGASLNLTSCRIYGATYGVFILESYAMINNCLFDHCRVGVLGTNSSTFLLASRSIISNATEMGFCVASNSVAAIFTLPNSDGTTNSNSTVLEIRTTEPRKSYTAVKAMAAGQVILDGDLPGLDPSIRIPGFIRILRQSEYDSSEYRGVVLESMGMMMGTSNVFFRNAGSELSESSTVYDNSDDDTDLTDTVSEERQFIVATEQGAVAIE